MKKKIAFKKVHFITSALEPDEWPPLSLPEIVLVGRSNVGKSSLINHLLETKHIAKISSKPGKTRRMNFFSIDSSFLFVDLPGYGYANASKKEQRTWSSALDFYIKERPLSGFLFLCDMRRKINDDDQLLLDWVEERQIPLICILTKSDKLSPKEQKSALTYFEQHLSQSSLLPYSIKEGKGRSILRREIEDLIGACRTSREGSSWD